MSQSMELGVRWPLALDVVEVAAAVMGAVVGWHLVQSIIDYVRKQ